MLVVGAAVTPASAVPCELAKRGVTARLAVAKLRCFARATRLGRDAMYCLGEMNGRLDEVYRQLDARGGCAVTGNAAAVHEYLVHAVADLVARLRPDPVASRCAAIKLGAAGKRLGGALRCAPGDGACLMRVGHQFDQSFARAERGSTCLTTGDGGMVATQADDGAADLASLIATGVLPPDPAPANLQAMVVGVGVELAWTSPDPDSGNVQVRLVRRLATPPGDADDPAATLVYAGAGDAATDPITGLLPDTPEAARTYHYAVFGCTAGGVCEPTGSRATVTPTLVQTLLGGGYVLYFRHAIATLCTDRTDLGTASTTTSPDWWKSCDAACGTATARQLTQPTADTETTAVRDAFDARAIPVGRVLSSEFCRCVTTAQLMDFGPAIETTPLVTFFVYDDVQDRCTTSRTLVATAPAAGTNTSIVTHVGMTCDDLGTLATSEALVFKPDGAGSTTQVTRVTWDEWATLP